MQFVLLAGVHQDANGIHEPGDIVESSSNLAERWPERFIAWTDADERTDLPQEEEEE